MGLENLNQFSGGGDMYRHTFGRLVFTEGVKYMADEAGAYWLIDAIASYQGSKALNTDMLRDFQLWELEVTEKNGRRSAVLTCRADDGVKPAVTQNIEYTDFPLPSIKFYVERGEEMTLMLPAEH